MLKQLDFTQNEGTNFRITARQEKNKRGQQCAASNADEAIEQRIHTPVMSGAVACRAVALCKGRKTSLALSSIIIRDSSTSLGMTRGPAAHVIPSLGEGSRCEAFKLTSAGFFDSAALRSE